MTETTGGDGGGAGIWKSSLTSLKAGLKAGLSWHCQLKYSHGLSMWFGFLTIWQLNFQKECPQTRFFKRTRWMLHGLFWSTLRSHKTSLLLYYFDYLLLGELQGHLVEKQVRWENVVAAFFRKYILLLSGKVEVNSVQWDYQVEIAPKWGNPYISQVGQSCNSVCVIYPTLYSCVGYI